MRQTGGRRPAPDTERTGYPAAKPGQRRSELAGVTVHLALLRWRHGPLSLVTRQEGGKHSDHLVWTLRGLRLKPPDERYEHGVPAVFPPVSRARDNGVWPQTTWTAPAMRRRCTSGCSARSLYRPAGAAQ